MSDEELAAIEAGPMTDKELYSIEIRADRATPGKWAVGSWLTQCVSGPGHQNHKRDECQYTHRILPEGKDIIIEDNPPVTLIAYNYDTMSLNDNNLEFIANAKEDIYALVAEVKRLRAALVTERKDNK